jgi:hypothetical protein
VTNARVIAVSAGFGDPSALLKHECAYCLGQLQDPVAVPLLSAVLRDEAQDTMVRHEAGEALGAIGTPDCVPVLEEYKASPIPELAETCQIALDLIAWKAKQEATEGSNPYHSVDPAPPTTKANVPTPKLRAILLDPERPLFERYRALFSLRNRGNTECVEAIVEGLKDKSALFRHEMAYVLGQMAHPAAIEGLKKVRTDRGGAPRAPLFSSVRALTLANRTEFRRCERESHGPPRVRRGAWRDRHRRGAWLYLPGSPSGYRPDRAILLCCIGPAGPAALRQGSRSGCEGELRGCARHV